MVLSGIDSKTRKRFWQKVNRTQTCWLWTGATVRGGYGGFQFEGTVWRAHRLSYVMAHGAIPEGKMVLHKCDVKACVRPDHLYAGTHADNMTDVVDRGRAPQGVNHHTHTKPETRAFGTRNGSAKLTEDDAKRAVAMHNFGMSHRKIARSLNVSQATIYRVVNGINWDQATKNTPARGGRAFNAPREF